MNRIAATLLGAAIAFTPALALAGSDATLEELIVALAKTPEDHAALARYYEEKAGEARAEASRHERMGKSYNVGNLAQRRKMREHCNRISERYTAVAEEYDALAELHDSETE